jgi:hypothetical protein
MSRLSGRQGWRKDVEPRRGGWSVCDLFRGWNQGYLLKTTEASLEKDGRQRRCMCAGRREEGFAAEGLKF